MISSINRFLILAVVLVFGFNFSAQAQARIGTVQGTVQDPSGAVVAGANVTITQPVTGYTQSAKTDAEGNFRLVNVPFNNYALRVEAAGFQIGTQAIDIESAAPTNVNVNLAVGSAAAVVDVTNSADSALIESDKTSSDNDISQTLLERPIGASPSRGVESILASVPGFAPDDNGRLHPRGSESQVQYVVDGVPITDNLSAIFSTSLDARTLRTVEVLTGGIPAEFGDKLGGVVNVNTRSGLEQPTNGGITLSGGSFSTGEVGADFSTHTEKLGFLANVSATTTRRFLDPPTIENFTNNGRTAKGFFRFDYRFDEKNSVRGTLLIGGSNFRVPNRLEQQLNGQDQRQRNRDDSVFITYERIFSTDVFGQFSIFNRYGSAKLSSNPQSTPVAAFQNRTLQNTGGIIGISVIKGKNTFKFGGQLTVTPVRENFNFYPTVPFEDLIDDNGNVVPNPVNNFTVANPFVFSGKRTGRTFSFYAQDRISPFKNFTLDVGVRYDNYRLIIKDSGVSPRIGIAYFIPQTKTTVRASYNRFFQTPPSENLLLASSAQAAALSPLAVLQGQAGVRPILPDKQNVFEFGMQQQVTKYLRLDLTAYQKRITNFGDKDQFFDTGVIFPIAISKGRVTGEELRIETAQIKGFSGFLSYANARAFGVSPINGGLFLGESAESLNQPGLRFANDHDQRNSAQFQINYSHRRSGIYTIFGGRYDSGYPTDVEPGTTLADFTAEGFDPRLYPKIDFQRGRVHPRTVLNFSIGADLLRKERTSLNVQFDVQNLANKLFLYNFESVFSGTHIGFPRIFSGRVGLRFK